MAQERITWTSRIGFVLASAGAAVGLGAIWKFPYMAGTNGGSVFMLPYIFFTLTVGVALLLAEFAMGRAGRRGAVAALIGLPANLGGSSAASASLRCSSSSRFIPW